MGDKPTKEQIQTQYNQFCGELGHQLYRAVVPWLEILEKLNKIMATNRQMAELLKEEQEAKGQRVNPLEPVQSA